MSQFVLLYFLINSHKPDIPAMRLRNLDKEYPTHRLENIWLYLRSNFSKKRTSEDQKEFFDKWTEAEANLSDWLKAEPSEVEAADRAVASALKETVDKRRSQLYDWYLEFKIQNLFMRDLKKVILYAPNQVQSYAQKELDQLNNFVVGSMDKRSREKYAEEKGLSETVDYQLVLREVENDDYKSRQDIYNKEGYQDSEALLRYKNYLMRIIAEGLEADLNQEENGEEFSFQALWPTLLSLSKSLVVKYRTKTHHYKEDSFVDYEVINVGGSWFGWHLRQTLIDYFKPGFEELLSRLQTIAVGDRISILEQLKYEAENLKDILVDGEYIKEEDEFGPKKEYRFKRFRSLRYDGDNDLRFVFNESSRLFLDKKLTEFTTGWAEGVDEIVRKFEYLINNLELLQRGSFQPKFDIKQVFENIFILESEIGAIQATAFYLAGVGIVTCDHCVRNPDDGSILADLVIFKSKEYNSKVNVEVLKSDERLDIAILRIVTGENEFLGKGLTKGSADNLEYAADIAVAGFPNYNFGDTGYFSIGKVTGFRVISSVRHILTSNALVAGNSGGPAFNQEGNVIGIVVTGADSFYKSSATERNGLLPIEVLEFLS